MRTRSFFTSMTLAYAVMGIMSSCKTQTQTNAYYRYEPECLGVELDGSQTLRVWGVGKNKSDAVEQAKKDAVRAVCFKGIRGGLSGCNTRPVIYEVNAEEKYEDYFNAFFKDNGEYSKYVSMKDERRTDFFKKDKEKENSKHFVKYGITVRVLRHELKKRFENDNILPKK